MKKNKNMYYWLGGVAVFLVVAVAIISGQGQLFKGTAVIAPGFQMGTGTSVMCKYTYGTWSACSSTGTQTRTYTASPSGCTGTPVTSQKCMPTCTSFTYSDWGACSLSGTQTRTIISSTPLICNGGMTPATSQTCTPPQIILKSPADGVSLDYTTPNQTFTWGVQGFTPNSSGTYRIDLGCANSTYPSNESGMQTVGISWDKNSYVMTDSLKSPLSNKLDATKNMYCYWFVSYYQGNTQTYAGQLTAKSEVRHFIFTPALSAGTPVIMSNVMGGAYAVGPDFDTVVHKFSVSANSGPIGFNPNGVAGLATPSGMTPAQTSASQIVLKLVSSIAIPGGAACRLLNVTGGIQDVLATTNTVADAVSPFENYLPFTFNQKLLAIPAGPTNKVDLEVHCDTVSLLNAGITGSSLTFMLPSFPDVIQWSTIGNPDVQGSGTSIVPADLLGYTFQK